MKCFLSPIWTEKAAPLLAKRLYTSLVNFKDSHLFLSGGNNGEYIYYDSVEMYEMGADKWIEAPSLNQRR